MFVAVVAVCLLLLSISVDAVVTVSCCLYVIAVSLCLFVVAVVTVLLYAEGQILLSSMPSSWTKLCLTMKFPSTPTVNWQLSANRSPSKVRQSVCAGVFLSFIEIFCISTFIAVPD